MLYGLGRVDASGRMSDRHIVRALDIDTSDYLLLAEHTISAPRCLYRQAVVDEVLTQNDRNATTAYIRAGIEEACQGPRRPHRRTTSARG